jgi:ABC-2 type transport system permease protein
MKPALATEWLKLRRSRLPWLTLLACTIGVAVGALFMYIGADPDRARRLGLLGAKSQLAGLDSTWPGFLALLTQIVAVGGLLIFGMTTIWVFGREFADHTVKDFLALPTSRTAIITAKFTVAGAWCFLLAGYITVAGLAAGAVLRLPGWTGGVAADGLWHLAGTTLLTLALTTTFGMAASLGRGYLPGIVAMFAVLFTAQVVAALGYGHWYPYSVPAVYSGIAGPDQPSVTPAGYAAVALLAVLWVMVTLRWWNRADHT